MTENQVIAGDIRSPFVQKVRSAVLDPKNKQMLRQLFSIDAEPAFREVHSKLVERSAEAVRGLVRRFDRVQFAFANWTEHNASKISSGASEWQDLDLYFRGEQDIQCRIAFGIVILGFGLQENPRIRKYEVGAPGEFPIVSSEPSKEFMFAFWSSSKMMKTVADVNPWNIKEHRIFKMLKNIFQLVQMDPTGLSCMNSSIDYGKGYLI